MVEPLPITVGEDFADEPRAWLATHAKALGMALLLAHTEMGVIWGKYENERLALSSEVFQQENLKLDAPTLHDVRLFGQAGELYIWRDGDHFAARLIADGAAKGTDAIEEVQWLWGTGEQQTNGFTMMNEGQQGLRHAPPMVADEKTRLGLRVRHYVESDGDTGQARIAQSRLVDLEIAEQGGQP